MTAKKLIQPNNMDYVAYLEEKLGRVSDPPEMWLPQVERNARLGLIEPEMLLQVFSNIELFYKSRRHQNYAVVKRMVDICLALAILPFVVALLGIVAIAIKLDSKGPVFFTQTRTGFLGVPFTILKFRTMYVGSDYMLSAVMGDSNGAYFKKSNDPRVTRVGRVLRRWSVDETPQFLNILFGSMTFVGPRPLPSYDVAAIPYSLLDRFAVRPGLTGLWQVTARHSTDAEKNLLIDKEYVANMSWKLDLFILAQTPWVVLKGIGAR